MSERQTKPGTKSPKFFGKEKSLERRRSYLRGFPTVNCNHSKTEKIANSWSIFKTMRVTSL